MLKHLLYIMLGGAVGSALRYLTSLACQSIQWMGMPWGTLLVNVVGCFVLGILVGVGERYTSVPKEVYLMLTVGLCGSFTTFSTFAADFMRLSSIGQVFTAIAYLTASIVLGFVLFAAAKWLVCH